MKRYQGPAPHELKVGDIFVPKRGGGKIGGHYWYSLAVRSMVGGYLSLSGQRSGGNGAFHRCQATVEELLKWGHKK